MHQEGILSQYWKKDKKETRNQHKMGDIKNESALEQWCTVRSKLGNPLPATYFYSYVRIS
jgi:hypothetical protein